MIALPSDVARASPQARAAYESLLQVMVGVFKQNLGDTTRDKREAALALSALCVGGMVLSRTIDNNALAEDIREAARKLAINLSNPS